MTNIEMRLRRIEKMVDADRARVEQIRVAIEKLARIFRTHGHEITTEDADKIDNLINELRK